MTIFYDLIFIILAFLYIPIGIRKKRLKSHLTNRWGDIPLEIQAKLAGKKVIWLHAVSVGEVLSVKVFLKNLKERFPGHEILITTTTETGNEMAKKLGIGTVLYAPLDLSWLVRKFIKQINPQIFIIAETEIWPNLILALTNMKIPVIMIGGRVSDKSFGYYSKARFLIAALLKKISLFCMQSEADARKIIQLGAPAGKVKVSGNLKFDSAGIDAADENFVQKQDYLKAKILYSNTDLILVAASTHSPEEKMVLEAYIELKRDFANLKLIVVPRHIERLKEVEAVFTSARVDVGLFSKEKPCENLIVDVMGELKAAYSLATIVFVGGSLVKHGGQNMIEPAFFAKPVIVGPNTWNFRDIVETFKNEKAIVEVKDAAQLQSALKHLLNSEAKRLTLGQNAKRIADTNQGASERSAELVSNLIENHAKS